MFRLVLIVPTVLLALMLFVFFGTSWGVWTYVALLVLSLPTLLSWIVLYFGVCLVMQGKKTGGLSTKEAFKELLLEFFTPHEKFIARKRHRNR